MSGEADEDSSELTAFCCATWSMSPTALLTCSIAIALRATCLLVQPPRPEGSERTSSATNAIGGAASRALAASAAAWSAGELVWKPISEGLEAARDAGGSIPS